MPATVILLNGVGSVGKGSIARALQAITRAPFLHVEMDAFLAMLPLHLQDHPDGLHYIRGEQDGHPVVTAATGPVGARTLAAMRRAVAAMADAGCDLIVDEVLFGDADTGHGNPVSDYRGLLAGHRLLWVGVHAPLDVLEARERRRGNRHIGLARAQFGLVHRGMCYDLEIDAAAEPPDVLARRIAGHFGL